MKKSDGIRRLIEDDIATCPNLQISDFDEGPEIKRRKGEDNDTDGIDIQLNIQSKWVFQEVADATSTADEFGKESGLTEKQIEAITINLTAASTVDTTHSADTKDAYHYMTVGLEDGSQWLNPEVLTHIKLEETFVESFYREEKDRDHYVQCMFRLNSCPSLLFNWEEDSRNTQGRKPYKCVSEFVLGVQVTWAGTPRRELVDLMECRGRALTLMRVAKKKQLPALLSNEVLQFCLPAKVVPVVLYWKAFKARNRSSHSMAAIKTYPPPLSSNPQHPSINVMSLLMKLLSKDLPSEVSEEDFLFFLLCLCNNQAIARGGKWDPRSNRVSYYAVNTIDEWNRIET